MPKIAIFHTLRTEQNYAIQIARSLPWFRKNGYRPVLPAGVDENTPDAEIQAAVRAEFPARKKEIAPAIDALRREIAAKQNLIDEFFARFGHPVPARFRVYFTGYGPGGSYQPPSQIILREPSSFAPFGTVIHEMIHLVIELPVIRKSEISHDQKESIVDALCGRAVEAGLLGNYHPQNRAELDPAAFSRVKFL